MRRRPLAAMLALLSAALLLGGNALLDAGWGGRRCARSPTACCPTLRSSCCARGCARGSGPLSAALVQFRREFQEVEHGEDTGSG